MICNRLPVLRASKGLTGMRLTNQVTSEGDSVTLIASDTVNPVTPLPGRNK